MGQNQRHAMATAVIGRESEVGAIEDFLERAADGPRALVLSGEPGIGKTLLWETGIRASEKHFARVLSCRGVEAEASLAFAALSELIEPVLGEVAATLVRPRRRAL